MVDIVLSIPKTIWVNFWYLPLKQAIKLPIWVKYGSKISVHGGGRILIRGTVELAMIRIGFHKVPICNYKDKTMITIDKKGQLIFLGTAHLGNGSKLQITTGAALILGDNFAISASSAINCYENIVFGDDIQFSWNCLVMSSDTHSVFDENGTRMNEDRKISFGNKVWIGCNVTILKGTTVPSNCVIGANSVVTGHLFKGNTLIVGNPAKSIKKIGGWRL